MALFDIYKFRKLLESYRDGNGGRDEIQKIIDTGSITVENEIVSMFGTRDIPDVKKSSNVIIPVFIILFILIIFFILMFIVMRK